MFTGIARQLEKVKVDSYYVSQFSRNDTIYKRSDIHVSGTFSSIPLQTFLTA